MRYIYIIMVMCALCGIARADDVAIASIWVQGPGGVQQYYTMGEVYATMGGSSVADAWGVDAVLYVELSDSSLLSFQGADDEGTIAAALPSAPPTGGGDRVEVIFPDLGGGWGLPHYLAAWAGLLYGALWAVAISRGLH